MSFTKNKGVDAKVKEKVAEIGVKKQPFISEVAEVAREDAVVHKEPHDTPPVSVAEGTEHVAIVGLGYVGLPLALLTAKQKTWFRVTGIDIDGRRLSDITKKSVADLDDESVVLLKDTPMLVSDDFAAARGANVFIICVPTPVSEDHLPDLSPVLAATDGIAPLIGRGSLIILESTVNPGTSEEMLIPRIEQKTGLTAGIDFDFAHCPERINPGDTKWTPKKLPRVVGGINRRSTARAAGFYRSILESPIKEMASVKEAEAVKMVENSFRDINIAFVNELAMSFAKLGIDIEHVLDGAATKPFSFMRHSPGCGVGGHCIPVDPYYLIRYAAQNGFRHRFLSLAREINNGMPAFTIELLRKALAKSTHGKQLRGSTIALLGLSYKANIGDLRESPAFEMLSLLTDEGVTVRVFEPHALEKSTVSSIEAALQNADAAIIATNHKEFTALTPADFIRRGVPIVVDGRNCLPKEIFTGSGVRYVGIGR